MFFILLMEENISGSHNGRQQQINKFSRTCNSKFFSPILSIDFSKYHSNLPRSYKTFTGKFAMIIKISMHYKLMVLESWGKKALLHYMAFN